jgi:hypothetical protein
MAILGADDRGNGQHRVVLLNQPGASGSSGVRPDKGVSHGFAETRNFRVM